jgi:hypothetical protein
MLIWLSLSLSLHMALSIFLSLSHSLSLSLYSDKQTITINKCTGWPGWALGTNNEFLEKQGRKQIIE